MSSELFNYLNRAVQDIWGTWLSQERYSAMTCAILNWIQIDTITGHLTCPHGSITASGQVPYNVDGNIKERISPDISSLFCSILSPSISWASFVCSLASPGNTISLWHHNTLPRAGSNVVQCQRRPPDAEPMSGRLIGKGGSCQTHREKNKSNSFVRGC